jgi:hypothetical protein
MIKKWAYRSKKSGVRYMGDCVPDELRVALRAAVRSLQT